MNMEECIPCTATLTLIQPSVPWNLQSMTQPPVELISLRGNRVELGRSMSSGVVIQSLQISRRHCVFEYKDSKWWIEDFSTNGISINETSLLKLIAAEISNNDMINLVPGILSYRFEYKNNPLTISTLVREAESVLAQREPVTLAWNHNRRAIHSDNEDTSDSLLSIENADDPFQSALGFDVNENDDIEMLAPTDNQTKDSWEVQCKRPFDVLKPRNTSFSKNGLGPTGIEAKRQKTGAGNPFCWTVSDKHENDELWDLDDSILILTPEPKQNKTEAESMDVIVSPVVFPTTTAALPSPKPATPKKESQAEALEREVLNTQLKTYIDKCQELKNEKSIMCLNYQIERDRFNQELSELKTKLEYEKLKMSNSLSEALESELLCCICNEIYIIATVIDCGHSFCELCISEWKKKKNDCPICRKPITKCVRHVEMNNFLLKVHTLLAKDFQEKRNLLLKDREEEVTVARAVQNAEAAERARPGLRGGRGGRGRAAAAAGGHPANFDLQDAYLNQLQGFHLEDFDDLMMGTGRWQGVMNELVVPLTPVPHINRRSSRARRGAFQNMEAAIDAVVHGHNALGVAGTRSRGRPRRGAGTVGQNAPMQPPAAAAGAPDLITLDDSQDFGAPPLLVPAATAAPVQTTAAARGRRNSTLAFIF